MNTDNTISVEPGEALQNLPVAGNPYVGPNTFAYDQRRLYFGREREARDLLALVISNRVVLFFSQSGAGKSSLINTRLAPGLRDRGFEVMPVGRVRGSPPQGYEVANIYAYNLMTVLDESDQDDSRFANMRLSEFLISLTFANSKCLYSPEGATLPDTASIEAHTPNGNEASDGDLTIPPRVLIIDQFEELLTTHPDQWEKRADFFDQLREAMEDDPYLWVVFSMREDFVAGMAPFAHLIPDGLRTRYPMQRMEAEAALEAIREPAKLGGREFAAGVAEQLVDNLRQIRIQDPLSGQIKTRLGQFVEPVQLQVVCFQLWEKLQNELPGPIQLTDLERAGDVDEALKSYYEETLRGICQDGDVSQRYGNSKSLERKLRDWFSRELITEGGTRGFVLQGPLATGAMPNAIVNRLRDRFLVRSEDRAGATWIELVHDRFVEPIRRANEEWHEEMLRQNPLEQAATRWDEQGRPDDLLYTGSLLHQARNSGDRTELVNEFLKRSEEVQLQREMDEALQQAAAEKHKRRQLLWLVGGLVVAVLLALVASLSALDRQREAQAQANTAATQAAIAATEAQVASLAKATADAAQATAEAASATAVALAKKQEIAANEAKEAKAYAESLNLANQSNQSAGIDLARALLLGLEAYQAGATANAGASAAAQDATLKALLSSNDYLYDHLYPSQRLPHDDFGPLSQVAVDEPGKHLAIAASNGQVLVWDLATDKPLAPTLQIGTSEFRPAIELSRDGRKLATASGWRSRPAAPVHDLLLWDLTQTPPRSEPLAGQIGSIWGLSFHPDGSQLAVGNYDGTITLWNLTASLVLSRTLITSASDDWVYTVAFDASGDRLAAGMRSGSIVLWEDLTSRTPISDTLDGHSEGVNHLTFGPDGRWLASASDDDSVRLWDLATPDRSSEALDFHTKNVNAVAFSADGTMLASAGEDNHLVVWDVASRRPLAQVRQFSNSVRDVVFVPGREQFLTVDAQGRTLFWDHTQGYSLARRLPIDTGRIQRVAVGPDGAVAIVNDKGASVWRAIDGPTPLSSTLDLPLVAAISITATAAMSDRIAVADTRGAIYLRSLSNTDARPAPINTGLQINALALSPAGARLAVAGCVPPGEAPAQRCRADVVEVWDVAGTPPTRLHTVQPERGAAQRVAFSPDGRLLAIAAGAGVELWDPAQAGLLWSRELSNPIIDLTFGPSRIEPLLLATDARDIVLFSMLEQNRAVVDRLRPTENFSATAFAFSPDGVLLAGGGCIVDMMMGRCSQGVIQLWDVASRQPIGPLIRSRAPARQIQELAFHPQENWLISRSDDAQLVALRTDFIVWRDLACARAGRNLTYEEWRAAFPLGDSDTTRLTCQTPPFAYPLHHTFAAVKVTEAESLLAICVPESTEEALALLRAASEIPTDIQLDLIPDEHAAHLLLRQASTMVNRNEFGKASQCLEQANNLLPPFERIAVDQAIGVSQVTAEGGRLTGEGHYPEALAVLQTAYEDWQRIPDWGKPNLTRAFRTLCAATQRSAPDVGQPACDRFAALANTIAAGQPVTGSIQADGGDIWVFAARQWDVVSIRLEQDRSSLDPIVYLETLDNRPLISDDDSGGDVNSLIGDYVLPADGVYIIRPGAYGSTTGAYRLSLHQSGARQIDVGDVQTNTLTIETVNDIWRFTGRADQLVTLAAQTPAGAPPAFSLWRSDNTRLADSDSHGRIHGYTLPRDDEYLIKMSMPTTVTTYTLALIEEPLQPLILDGRTVTATTSATTFWSFEGETGQVISLRLESEEGASPPSFTLLNPNGQQQTIDASGAGSARAELRNHVLTSDGLYMVKVSRPVVDNLYAFTANTIQPQPLVVGAEPVTPNSDQAVWSFEGRPGQVFSLTVRASEVGVAPMLRLVSAHGDEIAKDDNPNRLQQAQIKDMVLSTGGLHLITVSGRNVTENYTLALQEQQPPQLALATPVTATISQETLWAFAGQAGQGIIVALNHLDDDFDPYLTLLDANGQQLASDDDSGGNLNARISGFVAPSTGNYLVKVGRAGSNERYRLQIMEETPDSLPITGEPVNSDVISQTLWTFEGQAGDIVTLRLESLNQDFDPFLTLLTAEGQELASDDNSAGNNNARLHGYVLPAGDTYLVRVGRPGRGAYRLQFTQETPQPLGDSFQQIANLADVTIWSFEGRAGQIFNITLDRVRGEYTPQLTLMSAKGQEVRRDDNYGGNSSAGLENVVLAADGLYLVKVGGRGNAVPYRLAVEEVTPARLEFAERQSATTQTTPLWAFEGQAGQVVTLSLSSDSDRFDPLLTLMDPTGATLAQDDDSGGNLNALIGPTVLPVTGRYLVQTGRSRSTESYSLLLDAVPPVTTTLGVTLSAEIPGSSWAFAGSAGQLVRIAVEPPAGAFPAFDLTLVSPEGQVIARKRNSLLLSLVASGVYTLAATTLPKNASSQPVVLSLVEADVRPFDADGRVEAELAAGETHYWSFGGGVQAGVAITITGAGLRPYVELYGPDGVLATMYDGSRRSARAILTSATPLPGDYLLVVRAKSATTGGAYTLALSEIDLPPIPQLCNLSGDPEYGSIGVGSRVRLGRHRAVNGSTFWDESGMAPYVGRMAVVTSLRGRDDSGCPIITVDIDQGRYSWRIRDMALSEQ